MNFINENDANNLLFSISYEIGYKFSTSLLFYTACQLLNLLSMQARIIIFCYTFHP